MTPAHFDNIVLGPSDDPKEHPPDSEGVTSVDGGDSGDGGDAS